MTTFQTQTRSTLRTRLIEAANAIGANANATDIRDARSLRVMAEDPMDMALFDSWLDGPWLAVKHNLEGNRLRWVVVEFLVGRESNAAYRLYADEWIHHGERLPEPPETDDDD